MILVMYCMSVTGQLQKGVVKTRGRMVNGHLQPGLGLNGATIKLGDRNVLSKEEQGMKGIFSFPVIENHYVVKDVFKKGYNLVDLETCRSYTCSKEPLYVIMETPEQQMEDLLEAQEQISKTLREQLKKSRQEIQRLKDEKKITEEDYRQRLAKLMENQQNSQKLIADMAQKYAQMDYDQMDSLNQRINDAILSGRLMEADSLLRSKGDMKGRISEVRREQQAETREEQALAQRQENLKTSKEGTKKKIEDIAADCYKFFDRFKLENQHDSAAYYTELRAELDTTNAEWQLDAALYFHSQHMFKKAQMYYFNAIDIYFKQVDGISAAETITNLANLLSESHDFEGSKRMYKLALSTYSEASKLNKGKYEKSNIIGTLYGLGAVYCTIGRYVEGNKLFHDALRIIDGMPSNKQAENSRDRSAILDNIATQFSSQDDPQQYEKSEKLYKEALNLRKEMVLSNPLLSKYQKDFSVTLNNLAGLYMKMSRFEESEMLYDKALSIRKGLAKKDSIGLAPDLAQIYLNLGMLYYKVNDYEKSNSMLIKALEIYSRLAYEQPNVYSLELSSVVNVIAKLSFETNRLSQCEKLLKRDVDLLEELVKRNRLAYEMIYVENMGMLASIYANDKKYAESEKLLKEIVTICRLAVSNKKLNEDMPSYLGLLSTVCIFLNKFDHAEKYAKEALKLDPSEKYVTSSLAASLLLQRKFTEAMQIYSQYKNEFRELYLNDLNVFYESGVISQDVEAEIEQVKLYLNE